MEALPISRTDMDSGSNKEKTAIRKEMKKKRAALSPEKKEEWDKQLAELFFAELSKISVSWVYLYMDFRNEAGTKRIIERLWKSGRPTAFPRVKGRELKFYPVRCKEELRLGYRGISEPLGSYPVQQERALVVVPGVAFDYRGNRMGYGGGFYDRFFAREPNHLRWALAYEFQLFPHIPCENWDQKMERIFTPERVIVPGKRED